MRTGMCECGQWPGERAINSRRIDFYHSHTLVRFISFPFDSERGSDEG